MSLLPVGIGGARSGYEIEKSLRFRASASAYLSRTFGSPTDATKWSYSLWVKRGALGATQDLLSVSTDVAIALRDSNAIGIYRGGTGYVATSAALLRDVASHYHILMTKNGSDLIVYVNGVSVLTYTGTFANVNTATAHTIGKYQSTAVEFFDGYMSEINFIDGQALPPSDFGKTDPVTGQWVPKAYTGSYGANGFYLDFKDGTSLTTLGHDKSGNGNNWTLNNISLTAGVTYDWMDDTPSNNFCTPTSLDKYVDLIIRGGGLDVYNTASAAGGMGWRASIGVSAGKWYWEITQIATQTSRAYCSVAVDAPNTALSANNTVGSGIPASSYAYLQNTGNKSNSGSSTAYGDSWTNNDVIGVALDMDAGKVFFSKNGVWQNSGDPVAGTNFAFSGLSGTINPSGTVYHDALNATAAEQKVNFGQRPFAYTPPTGFKALCTKNLPTPQVKNGADYFDVVLDSGANIKTASEALYGNFFEWIKDRANTNNHQLIDSVRGSTAVLQSNTTAAETTYSAPAGNSVGWVWRLAAGFLDVVTYTGTGVARTVAHALGAVPAMMIVKGRGAADSWFVYHKANSAAPETDYLNLHNTNATTDLNTIWNDTAPTSSEFTVGTNTDINGNTKTYVAYLFAEVEGFSKFGSYVGNGSADGPFVYCGFKPKYVLLKNATTAGTNWFVLDAERNTYNLVNTVLIPNSSTAEGINNLYSADFTSNGFKIRSADNQVNQNTANIVFAAFAECPFSVATAR